jgi:hypothetical protein
MHCCNGHGHQWRRRGASAGAHAPRSDASLCTDAMMSWPPCRFRTFGAAFCPRQLDTTTVRPRDLTLVVRLSAECCVLCFALLSSHFQVKPTHSLHTTTDAECCVVILAALGGKEGRLCFCLLSSESHFQVKPAHSLHRTTDKLSRHAYTLPCPVRGGSYDAVDTIDVQAPCCVSSPSLSSIAPGLGRHRHCPCRATSMRRYHQAWCSSCCGTDAHVVVWRRRHPGRHAFRLGVWPIFHGCSGDVCRHCLECDHWPRPRLRGGEATTRPLLWNLGCGETVKGHLGGKVSPGTGGGKASGLLVLCPACFVCTGIVSSWHNLNEIRIPDRSSIARTPARCSSVHATSAGIHP